jgi:hypothetical protein
MKRILFAVLLGTPLWGQVQTVGNVTMPAARTTINNNFTWLNTNKQGSLPSGSASQFLRGSDQAFVAIDTSLVGESGNLYFTQARARAAVSAASPISYDSTTGIFSCPTCGSGSGSLAFTSTLITAQTTVTIPYASGGTYGHHSYATAALVMACWDNSSPRVWTACSATVDSSTYAVVVSFASPFTGYVIINGEVGPQGATGATGAPGSGDFSSNTSTSVDSEIVVFSSTTGKIGKRATGSGVVRVASGVMSAAELSGDATTSGSNAVVLAAKFKTRESCFDLGSDNAASDLVDADIGPQGRIFRIPVAATVTEVGVSANAGTPNVILQVSHAGTPADLTSSALVTASSGGIACSKTTAVTGEDGATTCSATLQNTSVAAGDWIQTKTGSGFASSGAKRLSVCLTYTVN